MHLSVYAPGQHITGVVTQAAIDRFEPLGMGPVLKTVQISMTVYAFHAGMHRFIQRTRRHEH